MKLTAFALIEKDDNYLLVCETSLRWKGYWFFPGGVVKREESPEEAVAREVKEEVAYSIEVHGMFYSKYNPGILTAELCFYYQANLVTNKDTKDKDEKDVLESHWFSYEEITKLPLRENAMEVINTYRNLKKHRPLPVNEYA